jgi:protein-tyrosine phosphatase
MASELSSVLFVCLGNICRSPTAHGVFTRQVEAAGLSGQVLIDSAGTGAWHVGEPPDSRATATAMLRGYDLTPLRARQVTPADFERFDYVLAMDRSNLTHLEALQPPGYGGHLGLFLEFHPGTSLTDVPDPYYGGEDGFEEVLDLVEAAGEGLLRAMESRL